MLNSLFIEPIEEETMAVRKFIDFDKGEKLFYDNLYLDHFKIVVKMPLCDDRECINSKNIKIKKFNPARYTYLLTY